MERVYSVALPGVRQYAAVATPTPEESYRISKRRAQLVFVMDEDE